MSSTHSRLAALALVLAALSAPAGAEPMSLQESLSVSVQRPDWPTVRPLYETGLETPFGHQAWEDSREVGLAGRMPVPSGVVASVGRLGVAVDSTGEGGPRIRGLAWSPGRSLSVVAGGGLNGGLGASLSLRWNF